jgi:hypothetical protein
MQQHRLYSLGRIHPERLCRIKPIAEVANGYNDATGASCQCVLKTTQARPLDVRSREPNMRFGKHLFDDGEFDVVRHRDEEHLLGMLSRQRHEPRRDL